MHPHASYATFNKVFHINLSKTINPDKMLQLFMPYLILHNNVCVLIMHVTVNMIYDFSIQMLNL